MDFDEFWYGYNLNPEEVQRERSRGQPLVSKFVTNDYRLQFACLGHRIVHNMHDIDMC